METFSALLAICAGNSPVPGEFPTQRTVTRSFDVYFDLRPNKRLSKQSWGWWFETPSLPLSDRSSTPNVEGLPDLADLPDLVIPDVDSCTGNDTVLYTIYWRNCTVPILSDVFIDLEILNTPLILVIMLLQDNNIFKKLTSGIMDSLTGFQDNLVQSWWPDFPTGVAGHVGGTSV